MKKSKSGQIALILSFVPFLSLLVPLVTHILITFPMQHILAGINLLCIISSLLLSINQINDKKKRNMFSVISVFISGFLLLVVLGTFAIAIAVNIVK